MNNVKNVIITYKFAMNWKSSAMKKFSNSSINQYFIIMVVYINKNVLEIYNFATI